MLTRTVWIVSLVSLFTDIASEMLYPVLPIYLKSIGYSIIYIGLLEGTAEALAGFSKGYFGKLSDLTGRRAPFVRAGYALSAVAKPVMVLIANPVWVFFCRTLDRLGKGVRTGARDAILSAEATPATKGRIFGFHRGMDTLGAAIGPFLALAYLHYFPHKYTDLFLFAFLPGVAAVALTFLLKEKITPKEKPKPVSLFDFVHYWRAAHPSYRATVAGLLLFTLINSSDVFLLLMVKEHGFSDQYVIGAYIFYNLVYALLSYPAGKLGDTIGLRKTFLIGIALFIAAYALMAFANRFELVIAVFFIYGIYAAMTDGISKAWITNLCAAGDTATAVGTYTAFSSIATMVASGVAGLVWFFATPPVLFVATAAGAVLALIYFGVNRGTWVEIRS